MRKILISFLLLATISSGAEVTRPAARPVDGGATVVPMSRLAGACTEFMSADGTFGSWGDALMSAFERVGTDCIYQSDWSAICPGFVNFSETRKRQLMVFAFAAVADAESTCRPRAQAQGTTDLAVGLFQLENSRRQRNAADRHDLCSPDAAVSNPKEITFQMQCAAGTFYDYHCNRSDDRYVRVGRGGYWQKWRRSNRAISVDISNFPGCT